MPQLTKSNLQTTYYTKFADNTTGEISEQDMRDFVRDLLLSLVSNVDNLQTLTSLSGTNTYTATGVLEAYANGYSIVAKVANASTGPSTLNVNSLGAKKIYINPTTQATTGDLKANYVYLLAYDTALDSAAGGFLIIGNNVPTSSTFTLTTWDGVTFPTATGPTIYIVTADHGSPGDADYIPAGAWAIALTAGVTTYSSLYIKP